MSHFSNICRLCKGTKSLTSLFDMDGDVSLCIKTTVCIDLKIYPDDNLPSEICKKCKKRVRKFFEFKQQCLEVDLELRMRYHSTVNFNENYHTTPKREYSGQSDEEYMTQNNESIIKDRNLTTSMQCELCGSMLKNKQELRKHLTSHGEIKLFQCKFCPKRFTRSESNTIHMRSNHFGIKPYICEICGQSSTKRQDLKRHMKIHCDEKNHECHTCGRRFKRSSDLSSHIRTHSGVRPYKCTLCDKCYTSHSGLRKHNRTHFKKETDIKKL